MCLRKTTTEYNTSIGPRSGASAGPHLVIPVPDPPYYVERKDIQDRLHELLASADVIQPRAALWALGGMG